MECTLRTVEKVQRQKDDSFLDNDVVTEELSMFLKSPIAPLKSNPISIWLDMATVYPNLSKIVMKYLNVLATSVPCERLFSKTGQIMNEKKSPLRTIFKQITLYGKNRKQFLVLSLL